MIATDEVDANELWSDNRYGSIVNNVIPLVGPQPETPVPVQKLTESVTAPEPVSEALAKVMAKLV